jgi:hypothetical protein
MNLSGVVQQLRKERDRAQAELERLATALSALGGLNSPGGTRKERRKRRHLSAAARHRISLAQKARWRKRRHQLQPVSKSTRKPRPRVHWTQLPRNRARVLQMARKMTQARTAA